MTLRKSANDRIPISISLQDTLDRENIHLPASPGKIRILTISAVSVFIAICISFIAKGLIYLINMVTNLSFYGSISAAPASPAHNTLGLFVIVVPAIGGLIIGLMAYYGSKAIRGHGIPEAMEQILTNDSKINPAITYLKPLSSAIAIGTGGPFGAEGPIIATGGALGSTIGQVLKITHHERKIILAAGATAGMSAIFGSPVAGIFLAIELLLFEFSPRSIIPVALACITGAAGHHLLFEAGPVFPVEHLIAAPGNYALFFYSIIGIAIGLLSVGVTKVVYFVEDLFEHLPVHWAWWPAIGGLFVGFIGYFAPRTLGVGYNNITDVLSGSLPLKVILFLCVLKFASWCIALASGTSGGTLAPLLTIGGAAGALIGMLILYFFPASGVTITLAALVGMSAMFAGASRALLTSIIFALETTGQANALFPLLAGCTTAYLLSFLLMEHTIMTEKIARRGVKTPDSYTSDILEDMKVKQVIKQDAVVLNENDELQQIRDAINKQPENENKYLIVVDNENVFLGIVSGSDVFNHKHDPKSGVGNLIRRNTTFVSIDSSLKMAVEMMIIEKTDALPVISDTQTITGILTYENIMSAYKMNLSKHDKGYANSFVKRRAVKMLVKGHRLVNAVRKKD